MHFTESTSKEDIGRGEMQKFSSSVEEYNISILKYFSTQEEKFLISKWPCNVLFTI